MLLKNRSLFLPPMLFPLMNLLAYAGGLSRLRHVPGFTFHGGYTAFVFVFVLLQSAAFGGVFAGFGIARDFERGFARRLLVVGAEPQRDHPRLRPRSGVPLGADRDRGHGRRADLPACRSAAAGSISSGCTRSRCSSTRSASSGPAGIAMRFRSVQAGPLMQTPVFIILFLAPVYVPLALLQGWIHSVARLNPVTFIVESGRGFIQGTPTDVWPAFLITACMLGIFALWARLGLRSAGTRELGRTALEHQHEVFHHLAAYRERRRADPVKAEALVEPDRPFVLLPYLEENAARVREVRMA